MTHDPAQIGLRIANSGKTGIDLAIEVKNAIVAERERCAAAAFDHLYYITPVLAEQARDAILHGDPYFSDPEMPRLNPTLPRQT